MKTVLLADDNRDWLEILEIEINKESDFKIIGCAYDGKETIEMVEKLKPDIIVLDTIMPGFDGAYIVNYIRQKMKDYHPMIYVISGIGTDTIIKILNALEIDYYSLKPVLLETVIGNLKSIVHNQKLPKGKLSAADLGTVSRNNIKDLVYALGMPPQLYSTKCAISAVAFYLEKPETNQLTKVLYPEVANKLGTTRYSIEKNIRFAVSQMQKAETSIFRELFNYKNNKRISNSEFLTVITDYLSKNNLNI